MSEAEAKVKKPSLYDMFATDENAAEDGKWFEFGGDISVKIRRYRAKKSLKAREQLEQPFKRAGSQTVSIPEDQREEVGIQHLARGIIADWKGVTTRDGKPLAYSVAAAIQLLRDLPEFAGAVVDISLKMDNFREEEKKEIEGN